MSERPADRFASMYELGKALLPFASPKHRAVWFEYYDRQRSAKGLVSMPIPVAESAAWWARVPAELALEPGATESLGMAASGRPVPADGGQAPLARTIPFAIERTLLAPAAGGTKPYPVDVVHSAVRPRVGRPKVLISEGGAVGWRLHVSRSRIVYLAGGAVVAALVAGIIFIRLSSPAERRPDTVSAPRPARSVVASEPIPDPMTRVAKDNTMLAAEPNPSQLSRPGLESEEGGLHKRVRRQRTPNRRAQNQTVADDRGAGSVKQGAPTVRPSAAYPAVGDPPSSHYPAVR